MQGPGRTISRESHSRSLADAISLVRTRQDQGTVYYQKDGAKAVYDVCPKEFGVLYINGRVLTYADIPQDWEQVQIMKSTDYVVARNLNTAISLFKHNKIDITTGWDIRP